MKNGIVIGTIACVVAIILIGSALAPIINMTTTTTTTIDNDGAIGLRMDKVSSEDFTINYGLVGDDFTATNGTDTQVIDNLCIFYADDNVAVWMDDSSIIMLGKDADNNTIDEKLSDASTITITKSSAGLEITDGTITQTFPVPTWAYVPKSTGSYGFFLNETEINTGGLPVQYVGSFAGVNCYNSINSFDLPITLHAALTDSELSGAKWIKQDETAPEELNPDDLHIIPLDPSVIDLEPEPDAIIMTVPTPTYTDGDWGYDLITSGYDTTVAKIVSYSGAGGGAITIPATVGGYDVKEVGKGGVFETVFNTLVATDLIISNGIVKINNQAFRDCSGFTGSLSIPDSVTSIGTYAFNGCSGFTGSLSIPDSVTYIGNYAFGSCSGFTGSLSIPDSMTSIGRETFGSCSGFTGSLSIPDSVTSISSYAFGGCSGFTSLIISMEQGGTINSDSFGSTTNLKEVLNIGSIELTTTSYGLNADTIRSDIPALGYLAPSQYKETVKDDGPASVLLNVIPLITIVGVLLFAVGFTIYRRNY